MGWKNIPFTRIPYSAHSLAAASVNPRTANFVAPYGLKFSSVGKYLALRLDQVRRSLPAVRYDAIDPAPIMRPPNPCLTICLAAATWVFMRPRTLIRTSFSMNLVCRRLSVKFHPMKVLFYADSGVHSNNGLTWVTPAFATLTKSFGPSFSAVSSIAA